MDSTPTTAVLFDEKRCNNGARIGSARLNAEKSLNALTLEMIDLLYARMSAWATDPGVVMVILEATGDRAFCAGADLHRLHKTMLAQHASPQRGDILGNPYAMDFFTHEYRLDYLIHTYPKPVLCWGQGVVMGGGVGLMVGASHRIVTEQARVAMPEISIGLFADVGGTWFLNRAPGRSGLFLALTGAQMNASDAIFAGFADHLISHAHKNNILERALHHQWTASAEDNARALSNLLREFAVARPTHGPLREDFDIINELCAQPDHTKMIADITGIKSEHPWLMKAAATLAAGSPGSAALSVALQKRLKHYSLAEVFRAELVASLACATRPDLAEGIRALLIDKDRRPRWQPATLAEATSAWIEGFFSSPWAAASHPLADL